jgi:hypothetical protein
VTGRDVTSTINWSDRDFEQLLRRASELRRNQQDSSSSLAALRLAFKNHVQLALAETEITASQTRRKTLIRRALWAVIVLGGIAGVVFIFARTLFER